MTNNELIAALKDAANLAEVDKELIEMAIDRITLQEDELQELRRANESVYCAFCLESISSDAPDSDQQVKDHVRSCPKHPMRKLEELINNMDAEATRLRNQIRELGQEP